MELTPKQDRLLTKLEEHCKKKNNKVWVGTLAELFRLGATRDLLNGLEQGGYIAPYMQSGDTWTVMPTRDHGLERLAIEARSSVFLRGELDEANNDGPIWNEEDDTSDDADKPVMCKKHPNQKMTEVTPGYWECPICDFIDFR